MISIIFRYINIGFYRPQGCNRWSRKESGAERVRPGAGSDDPTPIRQHLGRRAVVCSGVHGGQEEAKEGWSDIHDQLRCRLQMQQLCVGSDERPGWSKCLGRLHRQISSQNTRQSFHSQIWMDQRPILELFQTRRLRFRFWHDAGQAALKYILIHIHLLLILF